MQKQAPEGFCKKGVLKNLAHFTEKHLCWSLFNKVASLQFLLKETPAQVLSCEVSKTFKSIYFEEHL